LTSLSTVHFRDRALWRHTSGERCASISEEIARVSLSEEAIIIRISAFSGSAAERAWRLRILSDKTFFLAKMSVPNKTGLRGQELNNQVLGSMRFMLR
jgi:hypothetical protein